MPLSPGTRLGSYQIAAALGTGGMGEVYRAHDPRLEREVALKVLPAETASDPARLERFTREARAIAALNHPHIVTIYSTEEADGIRFLTMELVDGHALDRLIPPTGLPIARFLELALPLADALTAAHAKQITHRDLKPANVMVTTDGRVKVLDFGLARIGGPFSIHQTLEVTRPALTNEGTIIGTMPYMSPEQIEGKPLDHRTDLFSLGVMFHEMLTGSRPFAGESSPQLMSSILRDVPATASELRSEVPDALSRLVHRCLEKRPDDRVQTARDIYNELKHVQKQLESGLSRHKLDTGPALATWVAVVPFSATSSDEESRAPAEGLTEDVTAGLSRFDYLSVVAAHAARQRAGTGSDARELGAALGAKYLLDGSIRRATRALRISVRLINSGSGAQLWSDAYARDLAGTDMLTLQDDLTDRIVATVADVHGVLMRSMSQEVGTLGLDSSDQRVVRLRYWAYHRRHEPREHGLLRDIFERVAEKQPGVAPFWTALAHLYWHEHGFGFNVRPDAHSRARQAATRALDLDPLSQHAWEALATVYFFEHDREGFSHAIDRVLALNRRNVNAMALAGILLVHADELDRGIELADRAIALNPDHPGWYHIARASRDYVVGDYEGSLRAAKRINMPDHVWAHVLVALAAGQLGRAADATVALDAVYRVAPAFADESIFAEQAHRWKWSAAHVGRMLAGYRKAVALRE